MVHTQSDFYNYNLLYSNDALALIHFDEWITFPEELQVRFCEEIAIKVAIFIVNIFVQRFRPMQADSRTSLPQSPVDSSDSAFPMQCRDPTLLLIYWPLLPVEKSVASKPV